VSLRAICGKWKTRNSLKRILTRVANPSPPPPPTLTARHVTYLVPMFIRSGIYLGIPKIYYYIIYNPIRAWFYQRRRVRLIKLHRIYTRAVEIYVCLLRACCVYNACQNNVYGWRKVIIIPHRITPHNSRTKYNSTNIIYEENCD